MEPAPKSLSKPPRPGSRRFVFVVSPFRRFAGKFHGMEVKFAVFPRHGTQIVPFFHGMEPKFRKFSTPWNPLLSPFAAT